MPNSIEGKVAMVTGAAGAMGRAVVHALHQEGATLVMVDLARQQLQELASGFGKRAVPVVLDVTDPPAIERELERLRDAVGSVDILVNNAGILSKNKSQTTSPEEWRRVVEINLNGMFYLSRAIIPGMKEKGWGRIVNVSSLAAQTGGLTAGTAYSTSKGGVISLTRSLAAETAPFGITANAIAPAYVKTPMVTEQLTEEERRGILGKIPVGRFCEPEEFAYVVLFLVSPLAGFITGDVINLNGGLYFN
ncbi:MAG: 3-oxoacyl-ACP reductase FabG [Spirochaetaceae bacterium]|nr:MAG: 3-oxoacyl-ACP reductase FabG [Spirochaetaceae bacterium]